MRPLPRPHACWFDWRHRRRGSHWAHSVVRRETASIKAFIHLKLYEATEDYYPQAKLNCVKQLGHPQDCQNCQSCHFCRRELVFPPQRISGVL